MQLCRIHPIERTRKVHESGRYKLALRPLAPKICTHTVRLQAKLCRSDLKFLTGITIPLGFRRDISNQKSSGIKQTRVDL